MSDIIPKKISLKPKREHGFSAVLFLLGTLFPPLAVAARFGIGVDFFINLVLTLCGYFPGHGHNFYIQNIRNNKNHARTPKWAQKYGLVNTDKIKRNERRRQWASRYNDRLPQSTLEGAPYAEGENQSGDDIQEFNQPRTGRGRNENNEFWSAEEEAYYNAKANASTDSGGNGRWHYPANFDEALPPAKSPKKKKDRWARTDDAHSVAESDGKKKRMRKKKSKATLDDSESTRRDSLDAGEYPEDAEGGVYGNQESSTRRRDDSDIFSHQLGSVPNQSNATQDHALEFNRSWHHIQETLLHPDERQLTRGIKSTDVPEHLQSLVDSLVWESSRTEEGATGACLEYLLKNDVLGSLVRLSEADRPLGIQAEVLRAVQNMVVLLDEQFLVHAAVHRAVLRLLRNCVGDDIAEKLDGTAKVMGAAKTASKTSPSEYEEDLVNLLCILCSRIRTYRELLMIFFHDKHWYHNDPLFSVDEEEEEDDEDFDETENARVSSPTPSQETVMTSKKPEYEFLLFNYLLRFVHREGQIGDFARAGLLFLMDVAMSPGEPIHRLTGDDEKSGKEAAPDPVADAALALAEYILDGDFSEVLGAGLGAVYSVLPTKLEFRPTSPANSDQTQGMVIGGVGPQTEEEKLRVEVDWDNKRAVGLEDASNPDFRSRLDHFLRLLEFLQDVLRRNIVTPNDDGIKPSSLVGNAIVQSILDAVRQIFLENILYPSILECSDADGSAVAVMSYIEIMIRTLQHGELAHLLLDFLFSEDNDEASRSRIRHHRTRTLDTRPPRSSKEDKQARRKSSAMAFLELEAPDSRRPTNYFTAMGRFTLKDLLLTNLRSDYQATTSAALQLLRTLFFTHCQLCVERLIVVTRDINATTFPEPRRVLFGDEDDDDDDDDHFVYPGSVPIPQLSIYKPMFAQPQTTHLTHEREMALYLALVSRVDPSHQDDGFSTGYDNYLHDALLTIPKHPCFYDHLDSSTRDSLKHKLNPNDPILSQVLESLCKFFLNTPEHNIALTGLIATLAICPNRSLGGWLTFAESEDALIVKSPVIDDDVDNVDGDDRSIDFAVEDKLSSETIRLPASKMDDKSRPVVHSILHGLINQLERYRQTVEGFDKYLLERRRGLMFSEHMNDALSLAIDLEDNDSGFGRRSVSAASVPATPVKPVATPVAKGIRSTASAAIASFLTPTKRKVTPVRPPETPPPPTETRIAASPFGQHYQQTQEISVEPLVATVAPSGPWTPSKSVSWNDDPQGEDVFSESGRWGDNSSTGAASPAHVPSSVPSPLQNVTLSRLLDNVVILEESIKELVAIIHARRSLGIDAIRYV